MVSKVRAPKEIKMEITARAMRKKRGVKKVQPWNK